MLWSPAVQVKFVKTQLYFIGICFISVLLIIFTIKPFILDIGILHTFE